MLDNAEQIEPSSKVYGLFEDIMKHVIDQKSDEKINNPRLGSRDFLTENRDTLVTILAQAKTAKIVQTTIVKSFYKRLKW